VEKVEFYYLPEGGQTQHAVEPGLSCVARLLQNNLRRGTHTLLSEIAEALQSSTYGSDSMKRDIRLGVIFYNISG
jgi:hypothetical protein